LFFVPAVSFPDPPVGYYDSVDSTTQGALRSRLHEIIDDHIRFHYTSGNTDTWDILALADEDPNQPGNVLDVYKNASFPKATAPARLASSAFALLMWSRRRPKRLNPMEKLANYHLSGSQISRLRLCRRSLTLSLV
jgi:hypothetical protein